MKKLLSYIWPQIKKVESDYSGMLELTLINGRKLLDSKNANYSFGSLQRILETGISEVDLTNVNSVLLLGLGGGSVIASLRDRFGYLGKIHAIDIDQKIISIAQSEFNIVESPTLKIENTDAFDFVTKCRSEYDLIIVDLFIDCEVPSRFYSLEFCGSISGILSEKGSIIFNLGLNHVKNNGKQVIDYFKSHEKYNCTLFEKVERSNTLILIKKNTIHTGDE